MPQFLTGQLYLWKNQYQKQIKYLHLIYNSLRGSFGGLRHNQRIRFFIFGRNHEEIR